MKQLAGWIVGGIHARGDAGKLDEILKGVEDAFPQKADSQRQTGVIAAAVIEAILSLRAEGTSGGVALAEPQAEPQIAFSTHHQCNALMDVIRSGQEYLPAFGRPLLAGGGLLYDYGDRWTACTWCGRAGCGPASYRRREGSW